MSSAGYHTMTGDNNAVSGEGRFSTLRPPREFYGRYNSSSYSVPRSFSELANRVKVNFNHFHGNYMMDFLLFLLLGLQHQYGTFLSMISFFMVFVLWFFLFFCRDRPMVLFNRTIDDRAVLVVVGILTVLSLVVTRFSFSLLLWVGIGLAMLSLHAVFRTPEDLFLDEDQVAQGGLNPVVGSTYASTV